jgi:hypothetical protein
LKYSFGRPLQSATCGDCNTPRRLHHCAHVQYLSHHKHTATLHARYSTVHMFSTFLMIKTLISSNM